MGTPGIELAPSLNQARWPWILKDTRFTAVGYGSVRDTMIGGFQPIDVDNVLRNRAQQGFNSLTKAWLTLPMVNTPGNTNGGTCYGDSGGPHFIHLAGVESNIVASIHRDRRCSLRGDRRVARYGVDLEAFERLALPALAQSPESGAVLIDEVGKIEIASDAFRDAVAELLEQPVPLGSDSARRSAPLH